MSAETKPDTAHDPEVMTLIYRKNPENGHFHGYPEIDGMFCTALSVGHLMDELNDARRLLARIHEDEFSMRQLSDAVVEYFESINEGATNYLEEPK